jgi:hypothetical protein
MDTAKFLETVGQNELPFVYSGNRLNEEKCQKALNKIGIDKDVLAVITSDALGGTEGMAILKTGIKFSLSLGTIEGIMDMPKKKGEYAFSDFVISNVSVKRRLLELFKVSMTIWDNQKKKSFIFSFAISPDKTLQYEDAMNDKLANILNCLITKTGTEYVSPSETATSDDKSVQHGKNENEFDFKWFSTHTTITVNDDAITINKQKVDEKTQIQTPKGEPITISRSVIGRIRIKRTFSPLPLFIGVVSGIGIVLFTGLLILFPIFPILGLLFSFPKALYIYRKDGATFKAVISTEEANVKEYERFINVIFK